MTGRLKTEVRWVSSNHWNINPLQREFTSFQSVSLQIRDEPWGGVVVAEWWRSSTHYLLLLTVGGKALGQQSRVLQEHFGDRLWKQDNTQMGHAFPGILWSEEWRWTLMFSLLVWRAESTAVWTQVASDTRSVLPENVDLSALKSCV